MAIIWSSQSFLYFIVTSLQTQWMNELGKLIIFSVRIRGLCIAHIMPLDLHNFYFPFLTYVDLLMLYKGRKAVWYTMAYCWTHRYHFTSHYSKPIHGEYLISQYPSIIMPCSCKPVCQGTCAGEILRAAMFSTKKQDDTDESSSPIPGKKALASLYRLFAENSAQDILHKGFDDALVLFFLNFFI